MVNFKYWVYVELILVAEVDAFHFPNHLPYIFWRCVTIYFGDVISPCISFGVFDDFLGFGSAVFISV